MLKIHSVSVLIRKSSAAAQAAVIKNGGFEDPWFSDSKYVNYEYKMESEIKIFPHFDGLIEEIERPTRNVEWTKLLTKRGNLARDFVQHNPVYHGQPPKPTWLLTKAPTGARGGSYAGAPAKPVWKPPGKGQRKVMVDSYQPDIPPEEFMREYSLLNDIYKDEMEAIRTFLFHRYVEPTIVEEESVSQIQVLIDAHKDDMASNKLDRLQEFAANYKVTSMPARHKNFLNWYSRFNTESADGPGRGQKLVKIVMSKLLSEVDDLRFLQLNSADAETTGDLSKRIAWNCTRNESMQNESLQIINEAEEAIQNMEMKHNQMLSKLSKQKQLENTENFERLVEESAAYIYPENVASKVLDALQNPITHNLALDRHGFPTKSKITTTDHKFKITQLEREYNERSKLREESKLNSNEEEAVFIRDRFLTNEKREDKIFNENMERENRLMLNAFKKIE